MISGTVLTSWPAQLSAGSGTALFVNALVDTLTKLGVAVRLLAPSFSLDDYAELVARRIVFNAALAHDPIVSGSDWVLGLDYDGFALPARPGQRRFASARALFADIEPTEPEPFRSLLRVQATLDGEHFRCVDRVIVPSEYARRRAIELHGLDPQRVTVIANGIDLVEWDQLCGCGYTPSDRPTLLAVSRLFPRKKLDTLLRALPTLAARFPDIQLRVVGGGFAGDVWRQLARDLGVQDHVVWLGDQPRPIVAAEFARAQVFVHPSVQETFGNVCLEAMGARRALVVTAGTAPAELVEASGAGLTVPPNDPEALAEAITGLLVDAGRREAFGRAGRAFAAAHSWGRAAEAFANLLVDGGR